MSAADIAKIPAGNVRVPRAEFVMKTGPWRLTPSPVTERINVAYVELIEAECLAAEKLVMRRPVPARLGHRPGWIEAIITTLNWAWRRYGSPPLEYR